MKLLHRIITPIVTIAIFPVMYFLPMFRIMVASGFAKEGVKTNLLGTIGLGEYISIDDLVHLYKNGSNETFTTLKAIWQALKPENQDKIIDAVSGWQWGIVFLVIAALILVLALALIIVSAVCKKTSVSLILSGAGIALSLFMNGSFNLFAKPFLSGAVNLASILGSDNQLLSLLLGNAVSVDYMKMGIVYPAVMLIFIAVFIFSIITVVEQKNPDK